MRVQLKGIHRVAKKLADGSVATYYYAWRGGPRLSGQPHSPEFIRHYSEAHARRTRPSEATVFGLVAHFRSATEFTTLAPKTRHSYLSFLKLIEFEFGNMPIDALSDPRVRGEFKRWRDQMAATPRKANYAWTVLARVFAVARDHGRISINPCERGGRLETGSRAERVWTDSDIEMMLKNAPERLRLAFLLALWTGQRQGDLLRLRWSDYDGAYLRLVQSKSGRKISLPVAAALKTALDATKRRCPYVLTTDKGRPWTSDGFRTSWRKVCKKIGISDLTFHDLRGSAVTRLALAGATSQEIAGVTGHSLRDVNTIVDKHYLGDRAGLAANAIRKLERKEKRTKSVNQL